MTNLQPSLIVDVKEQAYPVFIGNDCLKNTGAILKPFVRGQKAFIVTDMNVAPLYLDTVKNSFQNQGMDVKTYIVPASETSKSFSVLENLVRFCLKQGVDRTSFMVALGGGVVGDLTGFASSMILRGIDFLQIPTTLLSQVDSSVGGKTAIDTPEGKNLIGAFYQPKGVLIDVSVLKTLPKRQLSAGYAEMVKYGFILDYDFLTFLMNGGGEKIVACDEEACRKAIEKSCALKAQIVAEDEKETSGLRALLNFGHTFGHALEAESHFKLLHGEAVALGMLLAMKYAVENNGFDEKELEKAVEHFQKTGLPVCVQGKYDVDALMKKMFADKKTTSQKLNLVLLSAFGKAFIQKNADVQVVEKIWRNALAKGI